VGGGNGRDEITNVQCKALKNCHSESPLYKKYILIKTREKSEKKIKYFGMNVNIYIKLFLWVWSGISLWV
jgi:hypothetical protein